MSILTHWNLVETVAVCLTSEPALIATELVDGMALSEYLLYLRANDMDATLTVEDMNDIVTQMADVMAYLSRNNIVHRDVCARYVGCVKSAYSTFNSLVLETSWSVLMASEA